MPPSQILVDSKPEEEETWKACRTLLEAFLTVSMGRCCVSISKMSSPRPFIEENASRKRMAGVGDTRGCQERDCGIGQAGRVSASGEDGQ